MIRHMHTFVMYYQGDMDLDFLYDENQCNNMQIVGQYVSEKTLLIKSSLHFFFSVVTQVRFKVNKNLLIGWLYCCGQWAVVGCCNL